MDSAVILSLHNLVQLITYCLSGLQYTTSPFYKTLIEKVVLLLLYSISTLVTIVKHLALNVYILITMIALYHILASNLFCCNFRALELLKH